MPLTLIVGPMKSGKSLELIARVAPFEYADKKILYIQHKRNVRDNGIASRSGINAHALSVRSLKDIAQRFDVLGVDEINMFPATDYIYIKDWLRQGKHLFLSGLDLDYRGKMPPLIKRILELKPDNLVAKTAVCEVCKRYAAQFTQVLQGGEPVLGGLPFILPENGTYEYQARCRDCFVQTG